MPQYVIWNTYLTSCQRGICYATITDALFPLYPQAIGSLQIWSDDDTPFDVYIDRYELTPAGPVFASEFKLEPGKVSYLTTTGRTPVKADVIKADDEGFNGQYHDSFIGGGTDVYAANNRYYAELSFQLECENEAKYLAGCMSIRVEGKPGHKLYAYGLPMSSLFGYSLLSGGFEDLGFSGSVADGSVNAMAGAKDVITVGSFVSHNFNKDVANQYTVGTTSTFSSWGHTPDGRVHPLVSAPGNFIVSSMSAPYWEVMLKDPTYDGPKDERMEYYKHTDKNGKTHYWTPMSGTSMASPYIAGVAATWLSADPTLTSSDILRIAQETADSPAEPRGNDGPGFFINPFRGLCKILNLSGINDVNAADDMPYTLLRNGNQFIVQVAAASFIKAGIYSLDGVLVHAAECDGQELTVDASGLAPGIYVLSLNAGNSVHCEKIVVR